MINENSVQDMQDEAYAEDMDTSEDTYLDESLYVRELTLNDRCDSCGAAALGYAVLRDQDLLFCGHHMRKNIDKLEDAGFEVYFEDALAEVTS